MNGRHLLRTGLAGFQRTELSHPDNSVSGEWLFLANKRTFIPNNYRTSVDIADEFVILSET